MSYAWSLVATPAGSTAALDDPGAVRPSLVADLPGTYLAELMVSDGALSSEVVPENRTAVIGGILSL